MKEGDRGTEREVTWCLENQILIPGAGTVQIEVWVDNSGGLELDQRDGQD